MGFIGDAINGVGSGLLGGMGGLAGGAGGILGGGGIGGLLGGGGGGGILGGLPLVGGMFGGDGGGGGSPASVPQGWMNTAGMQQPGVPGYPVQPMQAQPGHDFQGDLSKAGPAESFFAANQGKFGQPTQAAGYWNQNQDKFGGPGRGEQYWNQVSGRFNSPQATTQNAQEAYNSFKSSVPQDMSPYYNRAVDKAAAGVNNAYGARGQFNSSAALQGIADATAGIRSQEAKDNADYGLSRAGLMGNLGSAADASSRGASQDMLSWLAGGGQLANGIDNSSLARLMGGANVAQGIDSGNLAQLMSGMNAAQGAQNALQNRAQGYFNNVLGLGNAQAGAMGSVYNPMIQGDLGMLDQSIQASLGYPREALNQSLQGRASSEQGIGNLFGLLGGASGSGGIGKMFGGLL